jgi:hypothetical protein
MSSSKTRQTRENTIMPNQEYSESQSEKIAELFIGRKIVRAEKGSFTIPGAAAYHNTAEGLLVLDDDTVLYLTGNDGGCSCGAGDYPLTEVATVDNIITSAHVNAAPTGDEYDAGDGVYQIFVFADAKAINVAEFRGSDGNGYYGTGFSLTVVKGASE